MKAVSDSTCFGQFYDTLHYQNYKTREVYYQFMSKEYHGLPGIGRPYVTDIVQYDSIIVVSWESGQVIRFLKIDKSSRITEVPSVLDQMPLVKYEIKPRYLDARKIRKVNDSVLVISNVQRIFSFIISDDTIKCVDSLLIRDPVRGGDGFDVKDDTLVILAINEKLAIFYHITQDGRFRETEVLKVDRKYYPRVHVKYGHGNFYFTEDGLAALIRTDTGFVFKSGQYYTSSATLGPLILPHAVALLDVGNWDQIDIYAPNLDTICIKPPQTMTSVLSMSHWGNKIGSSPFLVG